MRKLSLIAALIFAVAISSSVSLRATTSQSQTQLPQSHTAWVADALKRMQAVKAGMTRSELLTVFTTEGGLSTGLQRTFVSRDCPYFKVDVEFEAVGRPNRDSQGRVTLTEDSRDIIIKISRPYLEFSNMA
jgi:hypothetical protein